MTASAIKDSHFECYLKNSLKIAIAFKRAQFERIFKCHEWCKSLIARASIRLLMHLLYD